MGMKVKRLDQACCRTMTRPHCRTMTRLISFSFVVGMVCLTLAEPARGEDHAGQCKKGRNAGKDAHQDDTEAELEHLTIERVGAAYRAAGSVAAQPEHERHKQADDAGNDEYHNRVADDARNDHEQAQNRCL